MNFALTLTVCLLAALAGIAIKRRMERAYGWQLWTTNNWCDATDTRMAWEHDNSLKSFSDPEYQELLKIEIGAYMLWLDAHSYCIEEEASRHLHEERLNHLLSRVNDHETFA